MYTAASLKIACDSCLYICFLIVFRINYITSTNCSTFIMFTFSRNTVSHFKMSQSGNLSRYNRFYYKYGFFCLLFVHIGVGYDRESDAGCLKVTGRKGIKWLLNRRFCFNT